MNSAASISHGHKIALGVTASMLAVFAGLQYNDPDPLVWISLYGVGVSMGIYLIFRPLALWIPATIAVAYTIGAILLWPREFHGVTGNMSEHHSIELARESLGLLICVLCFLYFSLVARKWALNSSKK